MITIAKKCTNFGDVCILESRNTGSRIYCQEGHYQSESDCNGVSLAAYVHAIYGLLAQTQAHEVLMIGCGGGNLGTMLAKAGYLVRVVDINPDSITLARRYFSLPLEIACHVEDGLTFLKRSRTSYDAIIVDAFAGNTIPAHLRSPEFFQLARRRLVASGCIFFNVFVGYDFDASANVIADCMAEAFFRVRLLDARGKIDRNAIVMGGDVADLTPPSLLVAPEVSCDELTAELGCLRFQTSNHSGTRACHESWN
ncbi:MAG: spermidine synthase [Rhodospirillales bacterium]